MFYISNRESISVVLINLERKTPVVRTTAALLINNGAVSTALPIAKGA